MKEICPLCDGSRTIRPPIPEHKTCGGCNGDGCELCSDKGYHEIKEVRCINCKGAGEVRVRK